jgi:hypothetical protein
MKYIAIFFIGAIVSYFYFNSTYIGRGKNTMKINGSLYEVVKHDIDTQFIEKYYETFRDGEDVIIDQIVHDTVPALIDTMAILKDYYARISYRDTLKLDSSGYVVVLDTISQNRLQGRKYTANLINRQINEKIYLVDTKPHVYLKGGLNDLNGGLRPYFGVSAILHGKMSYELNMDLNKRIGFGLLWKIK